MEITGIQRMQETTWKSGHGDNWHMTWAHNDKQYTALCDGKGWEIEGNAKQQYNTRVYAINGTPPNHNFEFLPGYPDLFVADPKGPNRYYGFGILALDGNIYHFLSTPSRRFGEPQSRFIGIKLIYSPDDGLTWKNQDGSPLLWEDWQERSLDNMLFFYEDQDAFSLLTVLQMGKNYEHNTDGYIYIYAPNGNVEGSMNELVMFRVPKNKILDRSAYEYFTARNPDGTATWSANIDDRAVVHTFPSGWVNTKIHPYSWYPSVVYNEPLGVYMMANWGMGCADDGMWFGKPSYLGFWTALHPWGPWTLIHEETAWMPRGNLNDRAYQPQISPKWISRDGKSFWLVFTDFQVLNNDMPYYCFNAQKVNILTGNKTV